MSRGDKNNRNRQQAIIEKRAERRREGLSLRTQVANGASDIASESDADLPTIRYVPPGRDETYNRPAAPANNPFADLVKLEL